MSVTTEPAFYDASMIAADSPALLPLEESPWQALYREAASWIPNGHPVEDLGAGTGRFAGELLARGHHGGYVGVDFSRAALKAARAYLGPEVKLRLTDLSDWQPKARRAGNTTYVCLEVLEHLADDRELVQRIPPGHQFVFSVPTFESEAHLRVFRDVGDVFNRYEKWLDFRRWTLIILDERKAIHTCDTVRRISTW